MKKETGFWKGRCCDSLCSAPPADLRFDPSSCGRLPPGSLTLTARERRRAAVSSVSILRHVAMGCLGVVLDLVVFWAFDVVHHLAQGEIVARGETAVLLEGEYSEIQYSI